jgi:hypothetical protein
LVAFVVDRLQGRGAPMPEMSLPELRLSGLATGLTALISELALDDAAPELQPYLIEQRDQVAARVARFRPVIASTLRALAAVGVPATPVKGAELVNGIWPYPASRPMSDVDVVVPPRLRAQAAAALVAAGFTFEASSAHEDAFLAWGDGAAGRADGESVDHNGKVEVHPGWTEFLHGYVVPGFDIERHATAAQIAAQIDGSDCARLDLAGVTAHVIGHLGSTVVRCEVRAVNVIDVLFCHRSGVDWDSVARLLGECDPRLTGPGLYVVDQLMPGVVPGALVGRELARLPTLARRRLTAVDAADTLRDPSTRTTLAWRQDFARSPSERAAIMRQGAGSKRLRH